MRTGLHSLQTIIFNSQKKESDVWIPFYKAEPDAIIFYSPRAYQSLSIRYPPHT